MLARGEIARVAERDTVRGRFARAFRLHADGRLQAAIDAYGAIASEAAPELGTAQYFNLACSPAPPSFWWRAATSGHRGDGDRCRPPRRLAAEAGRHRSPVDG